MLPTTNSFTNVVYMFKCFLGDCITKENNTYVGLTTTTLPSRLTIHLNYSSFIAIHLKGNFIPKSKFQKIPVEKITIISHEIDKLRLQILEAQHIKTRNLVLIELTHLRQYFEMPLVFFFSSFFFFFCKYSNSLDNILFPLIAFCNEFVWYHQHLSLIQLYIYVIFAML